MSFAYPAATDFAAALPTLRQVLTKRDVPVDQATHALYVGVGYGCSFYPGQPQNFGASAKYGEAEALADLETINPEKFGAEGANARAIPWQIILPILMQLLQEWLKRKE